MQTPEKKGWFGKNWKKVAVAGMLVGAGLGATGHCRLTAKPFPLMPTATETAYRTIGRQIARMNTMMTSIIQTYSASI